MRGGKKKRMMIAVPAVAVVLALVLILFWLLSKGKEDMGTKSFVHPGILNSAEELDLMRQYAVGEAACEPWASAYVELKALVDSYYDPGSSEYINFDNLTTTVITRANSGGWNDMRVAASKVYNLSIAYHISGEDRYAETASAIMRKYADQFLGIGTKTGDGGLYDINLPSGVIAVKFCSAAEVLRYAGYEGWTEEDTQALIDMFNRNDGDDTICSMARLLDWTNDEDGLMSRYDMDNLAHGHAAFANFGALAYAVFTEDLDLYNRVIESLCADVTPNYTMADYSWQRKPRVKTTGGALAYNIHPETGQNKELDRDMTHSTVLISGLVTMAQIAYHQGDTNVYECHDRLLLKGVECLAKYNLGYDVESTRAYPWNQHAGILSTYNRGGAILINPMYEAAYNYYAYHSDAAAEEMTYLEELVNNRTLSPEAVSEDVAGMGTLLYSDADRKNVYAAMEKMTENSENEILAPNYMALVQNAVLTEGREVVVAGEEMGVITYKTPDWGTIGDATVELGIQLSSTAAGYVEFRLQSKDGKKYGQNLDSQLEAGNTGELLARIDVPNTNGEIVRLKGTVYDTDGNYGGRLISGGNLHMLYLVIGMDDADGMISYSKFTLRPDGSYELAGGEDRPEDAGIKLYQYGWTGSGVDFSEIDISGWNDGDLSSPMTDADGNSLYPAEDNWGSDVYLIFDLGTDTDAGTVRMTTDYAEILSEDWAVYGGNQFDNQGNSWETLMASSEMELTDGVIEVPIDGTYRYIMIGGYDDVNFMNVWTHCWDYMTEIEFID